MRKKVAVEDRYHKKRFKGTKEERRSLATWLSKMVTPVVLPDTSKQKRFSK
jgi:hypothetical protein